jgi:hypothetical protein
LARRRGVPRPDRRDCGSAARPYAVRLQAGQNSTWKSRFTLSPHTRILWFACRGS